MLQLEVRLIDSRDEEPPPSPVEETAELRRVVERLQEMVERQDRRYQKVIGLVIGLVVSMAVGFTLLVGALQL